MTNKRINSFTNLLKYLDSHPKPTMIGHKELSKYLSINDIKTLENKNILKKHPIIKEDERIQENGRELIVNKITTDKVILRDTKTLEEVEKLLSEYILYNIEPKNFTKYILSLIFKGYKITLEEIREGDGFYTTVVNLNSLNIQILFQKVVSPTLSERIIEIAKCIKKRIPVLLIISSNAFSEVLEYLSVVALGSLFHIVTYRELSRVGRKGGRDVLNDIQSWIKNIKYVIELEKEILDKISKHTNLRELLISVDTNPKYLVTALYFFKNIHRLGIQKQRTCDLLEDLATTSLSFIYGGDPFHYGYKQQHKPVPDGVFITWRTEKEGGKIDLIGIIDTKATKLKLNKNDASKYLNYIGKIRKLPWITADHKLALFLISLDTCNNVKKKFEKNKEDEGLKGFYNEILKNLKENEFIVVLPLSSLISILDTYLSAIRRIPLSTSRTGLHQIFRQIITPSPSKPSMVQLGDKLFCICSEKLRKLFEKIIKEDKWTQEELLKAFLT